MNKPSRRSGKRERLVAALVRELRDICGRIAELIDLFAQADNVLEATLQEAITREALGLASADQAANDRPE